MKARSTRSPLGRAVGLGSARSGVEHWWTERVSAVALVFLTLWLLASIIAHSGVDHATFVDWLRSPPTLIMMVLLLIALFHHAALGLQVVIEDYIHSGAKFAMIILVRLACYALAITGVAATLLIAMGD